MGTYSHPKSNDVFFPFLEKLIAHHKARIFTHKYLIVNCLLQKFIIILQCQRTNISL